MALVHLLEREAASLLHQVDEAEVARPHHDDVPIRDVVLLALLRGRLAGRLAERVPDHRVLLVAARDAARRSRARASVRRARRGRTRCAA